MVKLEFNKEFVPKILSGAKIHDLRAGNEFKAGDSIEFFAENERFAHGKITHTIDAFIKKENGSAFIRDNAGLNFYSKLTGGSFYLCMWDISRFWRDMAKNDGFDSSEDFFMFFSKKNDGLYQLIFWSLDEKA